MKKIIFFGDSLTAGYGLKQPRKQALPALISERIKSERLNFEVINEGINGDTTRSALNRLHSVLHGELSVFVLELGANDFLRGYPAEEVMENLQKIISIVKAKYPESAILLLGIELPQWANSGLGLGYGNIFAALARANRIFFVPSLLKGVMGKRTLNLPDGVHPIAEGYNIAAENIWPTLLEMLR